MLPPYGPTGTGTVTNVTGTAPISVANGTSTPAVSLDALGVTTAKLNDLAVTTDKVAGGAVTAPKLGSATQYQKFTTGKNGAGNITISGLKAGDELTSAVILGNPGGGGANTITSAFTAVVAADNTLAQASITDYSASGILYTFIAKGGGA